MSAPPAEALPFRAVDGGLRLAVRLTPRAGRSGLDGVVLDAEGRPALKLRLAAPPVEGAANKALIDYLAQSLHLRKADITLQSGQTSRHKILHLQGDAQALAVRLTTWIGRV